MREQNGERASGFRDRIPPPQAFSSRLEFPLVQRGKLQLSRERSPRGLTCSWALEEMLCNSQIFRCAWEAKFSPHSPHPGCHRTPAAHPAAACARDTKQDEATPRAGPPAPGTSLIKVPEVLLWLLCALLAADLPWISNFNLSDFIFQPLFSLFLSLPSKRAL